MPATYDPNNVRVVRYADEFHGSVMSKVCIRIGTFVLTEPTEFEIQYECAAWNTRLVVPAGEYEITTNGYWAFASLPGTVVSANFPSLFGGVPIGNSGPQGKDHPDVGKPAIKHLQMYLYNVAEAMADPESNMRPLPFVEPVLHGWCEHVWHDHRNASPMFGIVIHADETSGSYHRATCHDQRSCDWPEAHDGFPG